jgi:hypothetical protein
MPTSYDYGKAEVCAWIRARFPRTSTILDVGAGDGKWRRLLREYETMDAVEIFTPTAMALRALPYRHVYNADIRRFEYERYDLIIFGDVIEHLSPQDAQAVLAYAAKRCRDMVVAVPWLYAQGPVDGNVHETHLQPDLTPEIFAERYPMLEVLHDPGHGYCYYHRKEG